VKKPIMPVVIFAMVASSVMLSGCSKYSRKTKVIGAAIVTGVVASAQYFGNVFGLKHKKKNKVEECVESCELCETEESVDVLSK